MNCPFCNASIDAAAFFCPNCGKKIREKPVSIALGPQLGVYALSLLLPPLNLPWTIRYLKSSDPKAKIVGWVSLALMIISVVFAIWLSIGLTKSIQSQVEQKLKMYQGYY